MKKVLDIGICGTVVVSEALSGTAHAACSSTAPTTGTIVVCNYYPPGNFVGQSPLATGNLNFAACRARRVCLFVNLVFENRIELFVAKVKRDIKNSVVSVFSSTHSFPVSKYIYPSKVSYRRIKFKGQLSRVVY